MRLRAFRSSAGFTYIGALVTVVILGIMASRAAIVWKTSMQREKEAELLWRGTQYIEAMRRFYWPDGDPMQKARVAANQAGGGMPPALPSPVPIPNEAPKLTELKDLLTGSTVKKKPYLRKLFLDPITGKEFKPITDPLTQRIIGVASTSELEPIKQANFPLDLDRGDFENKKKYSEWQFICTHWPKPLSAGGGVKGIETTGPGGGKSAPPVPPPQPPPVP